MQTGRPLPDDIKLRNETRIEHALDWHWERKGNGFLEHAAYAACKVLGFLANRFFRKRYGHRAVLLETVAAVPGMVGAMFSHLSSLRKLKHDNGRIRVLMDEAENERMHLMTVIEISKPSLVERALIISAQGIFVPFYSLAYLFNKQTAHRFVGFVEEEAVKSYTAYLKEVDEGRIQNVDAPAMAKKYWNLPEDAKLRDVIIAIRNDEAEHRDVNHRMASQLTEKRQEIKTARRDKLKSLWSRIPGRS